MQPAALVAWTKRSTWGLFVHVTTYAALTGMILFGGGRYWFIYLVVLGSTHFVLDHVKYLLDVRCAVHGLYVFLADQAAHIATLVFVASVGLAGAPRLDS